MSDTIRKKSEAGNERDPKKLPPAKEVINSGSITFTVEQIHYQIRHNRGALSRFFSEIADTHEKNERKKRVCELLREFGDLLDEKAVFLSGGGKGSEGVILSMESVNKRIEELKELNQTTDELRKLALEAFVSTARRVLRANLLIKFHDGTATRIVGIMKKPEIKDDGTAHLELNEAEPDESGTGHRINKLQSGTDLSHIIDLTKTPITIMKDYSIE